MYQSLLSVLLMGMVPAVAPLTPPASSLQISIAPPVTEILEISERLSASGVVILERNSGQSLYAKQADIRRPMASLTKLMTAIIITENHEMDEVVRIPNTISEVDGNVAYLPPGEQFTVSSLLSALLIASANDAAQVLAEHHAGSAEEFAVVMNERAQELGLLSTSFANPSGLDHPNQYSTPQDMAWLTSFAFSQEEIASRLHKRGMRIWSKQGNPIYLTHTHALLHTPNAVVAGKTGTTTAAGECLVSVVDTEERSYIVVLLNSLQRYNDMQTILNTLAPTESGMVARASQ